MLPQSFSMPARRLASRGHTVLQLADIHRCHALYCCPVAPPSCRTRLVWLLCVEWGSGQAEHCYNHSLGHPQADISEYRCQQSECMLPCMACSPSCIGISCLAGSCGCCSVKQSRRPPGTTSSCPVRQRGCLGALTCSTPALSMWWLVSAATCRESNLSTAGASRMNVCARLGAVPETEAGRGQRLLFGWPVSTWQPADAVAGQHMLATPGWLPAGAAHVVEGTDH